MGDTNMKPGLLAAYLVASFGAALCVAGPAYAQATGGTSQTADEDAAEAAALPAISADVVRANSEVLAHPGGRIVGGEPVTIKDHPWQVALIRGYLAEPQRSQFCGGSIIADNWVLTAAHCVRNSVVREDASRVNIIIGTERYIAGGERIEVKSIHVHPKFDANTMDYDFTLLRLARPVTTGGAVTAKAIQPAAANASLPARTRSWVTGWGATAEGGPGSLELLGAQVPVVTNATCNKPQSYNGEITDRMICAGKVQGGVDSCQGDSGGPLTATLAGSSTPSLIGVVSWGEGCARRLKYGIYARVSLAADWIASTMAANR